MFQMRNSEGTLTFTEGTRLLRLTFVKPGIVRVTYTEGRDFSTRPSLIVTATEHYVGCTVTESEGEYRVFTPEMTVVLDRQTAALRYYDGAGKLLLREPARGGKHLTPRAVYRNRFVHDEALAFAQQSSIDGARAEAAIAETVFDRNAFEARLDFVFQSDEALFGLGSHEEGYGNLRGRARELYQQNMKAVVPVLVSTRGWGLLLECGSLMTFHDDALGSYWWADCVDELDFYFVAGATYDDVTDGPARADRAGAAAAKVDVWVCAIEGTLRKRGGAVGGGARVSSSRGAARHDCAGLEELAERCGMGPEDV